MGKKPHKSRWWNEKTTPPALVVRAFGGVGKTARALRRSEGAVSMWQYKERVPLPLWPVVMRLKPEVTYKMLMYGRP